MQSANRFAIPPSAPNGRRILVVDDNEINRAIARVFLEAEGFRVVEAADGPTGARLQAQDPCDMVLMDIVMPGVDGIAATGMIRAAEVASGRRRVPILALTAGAGRGLLDQYVDVGMDGYLSRPYERADLLRLVTYWSAPPSCDVIEMPALNEAILRELSDALSPATFHDLVMDFVRLGLEQATALDGAAREDRRDDAAALIHDLIGTAGSIGLASVSARARVLLRQLRDGKETAWMADVRDLARAATHGWHLVCKRFVDRPEVRTAS